MLINVLFHLSSQQILNESQVPGIVLGVLYLSTKQSVLLELTG